MSSKSKYCLRTPSSGSPAVTAWLIAPRGLRLKTGAFRPSIGVSFSCAVSAENENRLSIISAGVVAAKASQKRLSLSVAARAEPGRPFLEARPYQTISAHSAPAEVPLKPVSSNRFRSWMSLRISVRTPTSNAACVPPPWQATATFGMASTMVVPHDLTPRKGIPGAVRHQCYVWTADGV